MFSKPWVVAAIAVVSIGVTLPAVSRAAPEVVQFWLVDANTDVRLIESSDYQTLQLPVLPSGLSIEVVANGETESLEMKIGATVYSTENLTPYALGGDSEGNFAPVPALRTPGWITISAQPYSADAAAGVAGAIATLHLYINEPNFFVTDTRDVSDTNPGDGICSTPPHFSLTSAQPPTLPRLSPIGSRFSGAVSQDNAIANLIYKLRGGCTLRAAIEEANALPGVQSILIDGTRGTYALTEGRLTITSPMTLTGHELPLIDAQRTQPGVFYINGGGGDIIVNLHGLEITGGYTSSERGGGMWIDNNAYVQLSDSVIRDNEANFGGGIYNTSWVYMANSILARNTDYFNVFGVSDPNHAPDCYSPTLYNFKSFRYNTVGVLNAKCSVTDYSSGTTAWIDFGSAVAPLNPLFASRSWLGELAYYNLLAASPALNNAATASASLFPCPDQDMRGKPRPVGAGCDRGAIERQ